MPRGKSRKSRRGRPSALSLLSVADLMREVDRRRNMVGELMAQREQLHGELERIESEIEDLRSLGGGGGGGGGSAGGRGSGGVASMNGRVGRRGRRAGGAAGAGGAGGAGAAKKIDGRRRGRGGNENSLPLALHSLLQGRTLGVGEMADEVQKSGYKTKSKNFRTIVNAALLSNRNMFRKVSRGRYTAK